MKKRIEFNGMWFSENTNEDVKRIIVNGYRSNKRFRFWFGDVKTGKSWNEENDVCGYIGKSCGGVKIPLLIANNRSMGGGGLLDDCIVKIVDISSKQVVYQHPTFNQDSFQFIYANNDDETAKVFCNGSLYATCKTIQKAQRLCEFMNGFRMCK